MTTAFSRRTESDAMPPFPAVPGSAWQSVHGLQSRWLVVFHAEQLRESFASQGRTDLQALSRDVFRCFLQAEQPQIFSPLEIHREVSRGLPGHALHVSASMGFDTMGEALDFFDLTNKTARRRRDEQLSVEQGEHALRLATVAGIAAEYFGSPEAGKHYLHTPNFALGGEKPISLLQTGTGEELVLQELQTQIDGGPV